LELEGYGLNFLDRPPKVAVISSQSRSVFVSHKFATDIFNATLAILNFTVSYIILNE
jgi:hypothetical protein